MSCRRLASGPTAGDKHRRFAAVAEASDGVDRHVPSLVGIPPTDLGEHDPVGQRGPDRSQLARLDRLEEVVWDAVRHHEGIHAIRPQHVLHRPRDGEDRGRVAKSSEVEAIEPEPVVRSPREHRVVTQSSTHELVVNGNERPHGVPILGQDHRSPAGRAISADDFGEMAGHPDAPVLDLAFLVAVDAVARVRGDGLAPPVQDDPVVLLDTGQIGIADEEKVDHGAALGECPGEVRDPYAEAARRRVPIGTLERQVYEPQPRQVVCRSCGGRNERLVVANRGCRFRVNPARRVHGWEDGHWFTMSPMRATMRQAIRPTGPVSATKVAGHGRGQSHGQLGGSCC